jgi:hypothetical protein
VGVVVKRGVVEVVREGRAVVRERSEEARELREVVRVLGVWERLV